MLMDMSSGSLVFTNLSVLMQNVCFGLGSLANRKWIMEYINSSPMIKVLVIRRAQKVSQVNICGL